MKAKNLLLSVLLITTAATAAFAQFKTPALRDLRNLENIVTRATAASRRPSFMALHDPMLTGISFTTSVVETATQLPGKNTLTAPATHIPDMQLLKNNHTRIAEMRMNHVFDDVWEVMDASKAYTSQQSLALDLADFYYQYPVARFRNRLTHQIGEVYELPVEGIQYAPQGRQPAAIDAKTHVIFYVEGIGAQILERKQLENSLYFEPVTAE